MVTTTQATVTTCLLPLESQAKLPAGEYHVKLVKAIRTGPILTSLFDIQRGPYSGRSVYLVTHFDDQQSKDLLNAWCRAIGNLTPHDTAELAGLVRVKVSQRLIDGISVPMVTAFAKPLYVEGQFHG